MPLFSRLGAYDRNFELRVIPLEDFFDDAATGHAGAYNDDTLFMCGHYSNPLSKKKSPEPRHSLLSSGFGTPLS